MEDDDDNGGVLLELLLDIKSVSKSSYSELLLPSSSILGDK